MKFLFLESFYSGSHALFADGLITASAHDIDLLTLPGKNWRWRMLGAALYLADRLPDISGYEGLIVTDLFNLPDFLALLRGNRPPVMVYFHENQITYPQPPGDKQTFQTGMINIASALSADRVVFNSCFHMHAFAEALPRFVGKMPDCRPTGLQENIRAKSVVLYPGIETKGLPSAARLDKQTPPLIIWNHRWSYDKNYQRFFQAIDVLARQGLDFRLALLGENSGRIPPAFADAKERLWDRIVQFGFVPFRREYLDWLSRGDIVVSTANQENFGIAVIEAVLCGCVPLVPKRLSYPEIIPTAFHDQCLFTSAVDLTDKLGRLIRNPARRIRLAGQLKDEMQSFSWENRIRPFDSMLKELAAGCG